MVGRDKPPKDLWHRRRDERCTGSSAATSILPGPDTGRPPQAGRLLRRRAAADGNSPALTEGRLPPLRPESRKSPGRPPRRSLRRPAGAPACCGFSRSNSSGGRPIMAGPLPKQLPAQSQVGADYVGVSDDWSEGSTRIWKALAFRRPICRIMAT